MNSSNKDKSKLFEHFRKFRLEKKQMIGAKNEEEAKRPDHELSDEDSKSGTSSSRSTPSKLSSPSKRSSSQDSRRSSHSPKKDHHNGTKSHSISDSDEDSQRSSPSKAKGRIANRAQMDDSSSDDEPKRTFSRIKPFQAKPDIKPAKRIRPRSSGSDSDGDSRDSRSTNDSPPKRRALKRDRRSPVLQRKKKKKACYDSDGERWSDTVLADSDEEYGTVRVTNVMTPSKTRVFNFINTASKDDLMVVPAITVKRADVLLETRPFRNWKDLVEKLGTVKFLETEILNSTLEALKARSIVSRLMKKCLNLAVDTEKAIIEGGSTLKQQPSILTPTMQLKSYQMVGLNWLVVMHSRKLNGILADEMGLGKTIQVIAFMAYLRETGITGPHLIVCPTSTIDNWAIEFTKWCPDIRVVVYHGSQEERRFLRVRWFKEKFSSMDVIVTSYQIVGSNPEERKMFRIMPLEYVVFDEAHMLKNMNTQRYGHLFSINAKYRILLTGTPLQNSLLELMSLLNFVMPNMFSVRFEYIKTFFAKRFKPGSSTETVVSFEQEQVNLAKRIMKPFVMRRLKEDVLKDLPKKTNVVLKVPMDEDQKVKYEDLLISIREFAAKQDSNSPSSFMSSFMQLRKLSNHPLNLRFNYEEDTLKEMASRLAADYGYKETNEAYILDDLRSFSDHEIHKLTQEYKCIGKFKLDDTLFTSGKFKKLDELLPKLKEEGHRVVMFSQFLFMLDIIEDYLRINNHEFVRLDGSTTMGDRQELIDEFNEDSEIFVFLLTTKAGGVGINLTSADTVIIHDVDFNPYNDKQAEDRCHRLGQTRPVQVIRLISEGTVEEKIYAMAQSKLHLEQELIGGEDDDAETTKKVESLLKDVLGLSMKK